MKYKASMVLVFAWACSGCVQRDTPYDTITTIPEYQTVVGVDIEKVVIHDWNWETDGTTTHILDRQQAAVFDTIPFGWNGNELVAEHVEPGTKVVLTAQESAAVDELFSKTTRLYPGHYIDDHVADGMWHTFEFHFRDDTMIKTTLNNVTISSYDRIWDREKTI